MRDSGVFADDFRIAFNLPNGTQQIFEGLDTDEARAFYDTVVDGVEFHRLNTASNVEVLEFLEDGLRVRFKYVAFDGATPAWGGENEVLIRRIDGRYRIQSSDIYLLVANSAGLQQ